MRTPWGLVLVAVALAAGCGTPVGVKRMDPRSVHRHLTRNVLSADDLSTPTRNVLFQRDLVERFADDPAAAIAALHAVATSERRRRTDLYALAELSFLHAERSGQRPHHLAAAIYAYAFLVPSDPHDVLDPLDPRLRTAADIYNRALARGLEEGAGNFVPRGGTTPLPFGTLETEFDPQELVWGQRRLIDFVPVSELEVKGIPTRYRVPGMGAPLAASTAPLDAATGFDDFMEPWIRLPVTAFLRIDDAQAQLGTGYVRGRLTLERSIAQPRIDVNGHSLPLEVETTASMALTLADSPVWEHEITGFFQRAGLVNDRTRLATLQPYVPGSVPIVLVHGTASSPGRWAQMVNELQNDRRIGPRVSFWLFMYDTGNTIAYSAMLLRQALSEAVARFDPEGRDPALRRMIVIGHSQGGLLTKMTVVSSGDAFWRNTSDEPFEHVDLDPDQRDMARRLIFVEPLPFVRRVVFMATPHEGSYVAGSWLAQQVARLIVMPADMTRLATDFVRRNPRMLRPARLGRLSTSVDEMTPGSPFIEVLGSLPVAPGVTAHSIIAVQSDGPYEDADDGVVAYRSAHIDGVASELRVRSGHSCQDNPHTIEEVRRIVLEHLAAE